MVRRGRRTAGCDRGEGEGQRTDKVQGLQRNCWGQGWSRAADGEKAGGVFPGRRVEGDGV